MNTTPGLVEGKRRKDSAFMLLKARRAALVRRAQRALLGTLIDRGEATIDDVRSIVPLSAGIGPKAFGPVGNELAYAGIIEAAGFVKSRRPKAHARPVTLWRLKDRDAALRWLEANPLYPEPLADVSPQTSEPKPAPTDSGSEQRSLFS